MIQQLSIENYYMPGSVSGNRDSEQIQNYPCNHGAYILVLELLCSSPCQAQDRAKGKYVFNDHLKIMPTTEERIKQMWHLYTMDYYSAIKK